MEVSNGYDTEPYIAPKEESKLRDSDSFATKIYLMSDEQQIRLLCQTAKVGNLKLLERYLKLGLKDDRPNSNEPLYTAFFYNQFGAADLLIKYGVDLDKTHQGVTMLFWSTICNSLDYVDYLLSKGANPNLTSACKISASILGTRNLVTLKNATPLHMAARIGNVAIMQSLINSEVEISPIAYKCSQKNGVWYDRTPIDLASRAHKYDAMELLFKNGAKVSLRSYFSCGWKPRALKIIHKTY